jgi:broad specificity polyphosphatase/5'/3'-nucleotidase SurE
MSKKYGVVLEHKGTVSPYELGCGTLADLSEFVNGLVQEHGADAEIVYCDSEQLFDVNVPRSETEKEYQKRMAKVAKIREALETAKIKQAEKEYKNYLKLRKKFEHQDRKIKPSK